MRVSRTSLLTTGAAIVVNLFLFFPSAASAWLVTESEDGADLDSASPQENDLAEPLATVFDEILIGAHMAPLVGAEHELGRDEITEIPYGDAAEVLRNVSGIAVGRMGGHGLEPRLRGMGETNINVLLDGAYVHNACPNRMDPPTSFGAVASFDRVVVLKGVQTVRYGGGGSAGTILYQRETPRFDQDESWRLDFGAAYSSHAEAPDLTIDAAVGKPSFYIRTISELRDMGNYTDGSGTEVRSAFSKRDGSLALGWTPSAATSLELSVENNLTEDALFPGSGMDAPYDENNIYRFQARHLRQEGRLTAVESDLYWGEIDHIMDNYTLREPTMPMAARAETLSDTFGGRLSIDWRSGENLRYTVGIDFQRNIRHAIRYAGPTPASVTREQSILWPDARLTDSGLFFEGVFDLDQGRRLLFGARTDRFEATASEARRQPFGSNLSPRSLYLLYYGDARERWTHRDVGGLLRLEQDLDHGLTLFTGISRSVRPADATERFLGSNNRQPSGRWIGNPALEPSVHHQVDLGATLVKVQTQLTSVLFLDRADDYILRDRARAQPGILQSDSASIYRNIDAELFGFELDLWRKLRGPLSLLANAGWVRGENQTSGRPIHQIPPLQGRVRLVVEEDPWGGSLTVRYALRQSRIDDDPTTGSGIDVGETPGYAVVDLLSRFRLRSGLEIQFGMENVFDRLYADHLNRSSLFDVEQVRVREPGRTYWARFTLRPAKPRR